MDTPEKIAYKKIQSFGYCDDKSQLLLAMDYNHNAIIYASKELRNDEEVILKALKKARWNSWPFCYAGDQIKQNKELIYKILEKNDGSIIHEVDFSLRNSKKFIKKAMKINPRVLLYASEELKKDQELLMEAISLDPNFLQYAPPEVQNDKDFVLLLLDKKINTLNYIGDDIKNDPDIVLKAMEKNGKIPDFNAVFEMYKDPEFRKKAFKNKSVRNAIMRTIKTNPSKLDFMPREDLLKIYEAEYNSKLVEKLKYKYYNSYREKVISKDSSKDNDYDFLYAMLTSNVLEQIYASNEYIINDTRFVEAIINIYDEKTSNYIKNLIEKYKNIYRIQNINFFNELNKNVNNKEKFDQLLQERRLNKNNIYEFVINNKYYDKKIKSSFIEMLNKHYQEGYIRIYDILIMLEEMLERELTLDEVLAEKQFDKNLFNKIYHSLIDENPMFYNIISNKLNTNKLRGFRKFMRKGYAILNSNISSIEELETKFEMSPYDILNQYKETNIYTELYDKISKLDGFDINAVNENKKII